MSTTTGVFKKMSKIYSIPTDYRGCRFRSRTEARWAVFFDAAKIHWLYEPEGYIIEGKRYLPDFWLPGFRSFFEVKGGYGRGYYDFDFYRLFSECIRAPLLLAEGPPPRPSNYHYEEIDSFRLIKCFQDETIFELDAWGGENMFLECAGCGKIHFREIQYYSMKDVCCEGERLMLPEDALTAWFSARFEYGEKGMSTTK